MKSLTYYHPGKTLAMYFAVIFTWLFFGNDSFWERNIAGFLLLTFCCLLASGPAIENMKRNGFLRGVFVFYGQGNITTYITVMILSNSLIVFGFWALPLIILYFPLKIIETGAMRAEDSENG